MSNTLSVIIPAYNEEEAIASTLRAILSAQGAILRQGTLERMEIIVVNDGSRDATTEQVREVMVQQDKAGTIRLVEHPVNRGYGAAIKTGFAAASGNLLGFMDADGTCEPATFGALCEVIEQQNADVAIGSRMLSPASGMPRTRRLGNRLFAILLSLISTSRVTDSASGMRVLRRDALPLLLPLPDGLHFTPAMSARAVLDANLKIVEIPMPYHERVGQSKLGVLRDGVRFLSVILEVALTYRPLRFFGVMGGVFLLLALLYGLYPLGYYMRHREISDWLIYRLLAVTVFTVAGLNLVTIGLLAGGVVRSIQRLHRSALTGVQGEYHQDRPWQRIMLNWMPAAGILLMLMGVLINRGVLWEYLTTSHITAHWIYPVTGAFFVLNGMQFFSFGVIHRVFRALEDKQVYLFRPDGSSPGAGSF